MTTATAPAQKEPVVKEKNVEIKREGKIIILPEGMAYEEGIEWLKRKRDQEEQDVAIHEEIDAFPFDGAYALTRALAEKYGWVDLVPTPSWFGPRPPTMIGVEVDFGKTVQVPWGRIQIPNVAGFINTEVARKDGRTIFKIGGVVKQRHQAEVADIANRTRKELAKLSIYRGKAISVSFTPSPDEPVDIAKPPKFLDLSNVKPAELVFSTDVDRQIDVNLFTPIEQTPECREQKIPLKRGILLEGPYGTGKTLTAYVAAKKCVENGWTFVYLDKVQSLAKALQFAQQYQPCMVFAEDIDAVAAGEERTQGMNDILNLIDGVSSKDTELFVVLTTNHVDKLNPALLRPGRLDAVISVKRPDADAVKRLLLTFGRGRIKKDTDLTKVGKILDGNTPATIREVIERSKLATIRRTRNGGSSELTGEDLAVSAETMLNHLKLMEPKDQDKRTPVEVLGDRLGAKLGTKIHHALVAAHKGSHNGNGDGEDTDEDEPAKG